MDASQESLEFTKVLRWYCFCAVCSVLFGTLFFAGELPLLMVVLLLVLGPLTHGFGIAAVCMGSVAAGLLFPRSGAATLAGSLGIVVWVFTGCATAALGVT